MYTTEPLSSQGNEPSIPSTSLASQSVPQYTQLPASQPAGSYTQPITASQQVPQYSQNQPDNSTDDLCTTVCTSKVMKFIVTFAVFIISPLLMAVVGILGPFFLITKDVSNPFAPFLFSIYTLFVYSLFFVNLLVFRQHPCFGPILDGIPYFMPI